MMWRLEALACAAAGAFTATVITVGLIVRRIPNDPRLAGPSPAGADTRSVNKRPMVNAHNSMSPSRLRSPERNNNETTRRGSLDRL